MPFCRNALVRNIADTARWAAAFRALETLRADALFRDPFAAALAGERGFDLVGALSQEKHATSWVTRTVLFDEALSRAVAGGVEIVVNLGAGLDARPYRMDLPSSLVWVEVDLPDLLAYKADILKNERPRCALQRIALDICNVRARRNLLERIHKASINVLFITEGVLIYLSSEEVADFAIDLSATRPGQKWLTEICSPGVLTNMRKAAGVALAEAGLDFQFGPAAGPQFMERFGWQPIEVESILRNAIRLKRTPIDPQLSALVPNGCPAPGDLTPWIGVCLFEQTIHSVEKYQTSCRGMGLVSADLISHTPNGTNQGTFKTAIDLSS